MLTPAHLELDRSTEPGRVLLRAQSAIENVGSGPLRVVGRRRGPRTMTTEQAILDTAGGWRRYPTASRLDFKRVPGDRYDAANVGTATYWKYRVAAAFQVWSIDAQRHAVKLVRTGPKLDYCLRDLVRTHPSGHSPRGPVFPACSQDAGARRDQLGTSAGWSDVYPYEYPEQWVDVTRLRGRFAFVQIADPLNRLHESNEQDNLSEVFVALPSGRVIGHRTGVPAP